MDPRIKKYLPGIYKDLSRFTEKKRPRLRTRCIFFPGIQLTLDQFASKAFQSSDRSYLYSGAECIVLANRPHLIEVKFVGASENDLVSPEFLTKCEITAFGKLLMQQGESAKARERESMTLR